MSELSTSFDRYVEMIRERATKALNVLLEKVYADFFKETEKRFKEIFRDVIIDFYSSYSPQYYSRSRSLYNLMETKSTNKSLSISFTPENMSGYRSGYSGEDGLYSTVFRMGLHGGAIDKRTGDYRYRAPYPYYTHWSSNAIGTDSPLEEMRERVRTFEATESQALLYSIWEKRKHEFKW